MGQAAVHKQKKAKEKKAKSRLRITVEAEKMKFRNSWSAGSEQTHQTNMHPNNESVLPKRTYNFRPLRFKIGFKSQ